MKKILILILLFNINFTITYSLEADVFIQSTVYRASDLLSKDTTTRDKKIEDLKIIAKDTVDIKGIGFYTLGSARKNLDENQIQKYSEIFERYFLKVFQVDFLSTQIQK